MCRGVWLKSSRLARRVEASNVASDASAGRRVRVSVVCVARMFGRRNKAVRCQAARCSRVLLGLDLVRVSGLTRTRAMVGAGPELTLHV